MCIYIYTIHVYPHATLIPLDHVLPRYEKVRGWKKQMEEDWLKSTERSEILGTMSESERKRRRYK